jgi:hypothetical protein
LAGRNFAESAADEFLLDGTELGSAAQEVGIRESVLEQLQLKSSRGLDLGEVLAVPGQERWLGDIEGGSDFGEAEALGAELEELVAGLERVHGGMILNGLYIVSKHILSIH